MKKRLLALLVACAMIVSLLPVQVLAFDGADASVQTQAEETESSASAQEQEEADEPEESEPEEEPEAEESEAEEPEAEESEADESQAEEPEAEESQEDESRAEEPEADKSEEDESQETQPAAEESEPEDAGAGLISQDGDNPLVEENPLEGRVTIGEVGEISRFTSDRCEVDPGEYAQVDCWPEEDNLTITVDDEDFRLSDYHGDMQAMGNAIRQKLVTDGVQLEDEVNLYWRSEENEDHPWRAGMHAAEIVLSYQDYEVTQPYNVRVLELQSIDTSDLTRSIYFRRFRDDNDDQHPNNGKLDCWPGSFTVTLIEGYDGDEPVTREFSLEESQDYNESYRQSIQAAYPYLRNFDVDWRSDENPASELHDGDTIHAKLFMYAYYNPDTEEGKFTGYDVNVTDPNPFVSVTVNPFSVFETQTEVMREREDEDHDEPWEWTRLWCDPNLEDSVTAEIKLRDEDGNFTEETATVTGTRDEVQRKLKDDYDLNLDIWWNSEETPEANWENQHWTVNDHPTIQCDLTAHLWDEDCNIPLCNYEVTVLSRENSPIKQVEVPAISRLTTDRHEMREYNPDEDRDIEWQRVDCYPEQVSVWYGTEEGDPTFTGDLNEVRDQIQQKFSQDCPGVSFDMDWYSDETAIEKDGQWVGSWEAGEHTAYLRVNGVSYDYNVHLVDPEELFTRVEVDSFNRFENDRCDPEPFGGDNGNEIQWRRLNCDINDEHVVVELADGTTFDTNERDENDRNRRRYDNLDDMRWNIEQHLRKDYPGLRVDWDWRSDEQPVRDENDQWQEYGSYRAGETYDVHAVIGGKWTDCQVTVIAPLELSIDEIGQVNRFNSDRHWCDGKQGEDNEEHSFRRINCHPGYVKLTVNGTPREGDFSELMDQLTQEYDGTRLPWYWDSDEIPVQNEDGDWVGSWGVGDHKATLTIGEAEKDYEVRVIAPDKLFRSVEVSDITRLTTDRNRTDWWENDQRIEWKQVDCHPNYVKMTTSDGTVFVYDNERDGSDPENRVYDNYEQMCDAVREHLRSNGYPGLDLDLGWDSSERPLTHEDGAMGDWTAGEHHDAWIAVNGEEIAGNKGHYNVRVVDPEDLFASVTVDNISRFENDRCDPETGRDKDGNEIQWRRLDCDINDEHVVVKLKGGTTFDTDEREEDNEDERRYNNLSDMCWHIQQHLRQEYPGIRVDWDWYSDEEPEYEDDEWVGTFRAGNTYDVHAVVGGMDTTFQVEVKQALNVTINQVDPVYRLANDRDWCHWKRGEDGEEHGFDRINCHPALVKLTVNGMEYAGDFSTVMDHLAEDNGGTRLPWYWDSDEIPVQNGDEWAGSWGVGDHEATLTVAGVSQNYDVHVIAPSDLFESVEVSDVKRLETDRYRDDWWENDQRFDWQRLDCTPNYVKMVTSDGTVFVYNSELDGSDPGNHKYHELRYLFDDVQEHLRSGDFPGLNLELFWNSTERPLSNEGGTPGDWTANDQQDHEAWICVRGGEEIASDKGHYKVTLLPNPVESAEIPDVTVDAENRRQDGAKELMCPPNGKITLHLTDERTVTGYFRSEGNMDLQRRLEEAVGEDYEGLFDFHWYSDDFEEEENRWQHGTHEAMMTINGRPFFYKVHVTNDGHKDKTLLDEGLSFHAAVDATCTAPGKIAYWVCQECQKLFKDQNLTEEITQEQIETPAKGHTLTAEAEKAATCTAPGNIAYWTCKECGKYFKDAQGTQEITQQQTVKPAKGHTLTHVARKEAKVGAAGNIEYWTCKVCKKYFKDAQGTQEITQAKTVIPALKRITLVNTDVKVAAGTYVYNGKAQSPTVTVTHGGKTLTRNKDYSLRYANNVKAGTATVIVTGTGDYQGTVTGSFAIAKAKGKITASDLVVTASKKKYYSLSVSANCKVKYMSSSKDVKVDAKTGKITVSKANTYYKATITISGNDANYSVSKKNITVMIGPGVPTLNTAKTGKAAKTVDLTWAKMTKDNKGVTGYKIQYALDQKFTKSVKTQNVDKAAAVNATVKGLTSKKTYYFRIRAVAGKYYSRWSRVKTAKAK